MNYNELNLEMGIFWTLIWMFILVVLGNKSLVYTIKNGLTFLIFWILVSLLFLIFNNIKLY